MALVTVANLKGGCGKSTIAINLAGELASTKRSSVVLVDADAQGTATQWASAGRLPFTVQALPLESEKATRRWVDQVLSIKANYIVIDCPPHVGAVTEAAIGLSDLVLIPVTASGADLSATATALELVRHARRSRKNQEPACLLIPSKVDRRTASGREIEAALQQFAERIAPAIHQRAAFVDSFSTGDWIGQYAPKSSALEDVKALAAAVHKMIR